MTERVRVAVLVLVVMTVYGEICFECGKIYGLAQGQEIVRRIVP